MAWAINANVNFSMRVPTAAERAGDFSQTTDGNGRAVPVRRPRLQRAFSRGSQLLGGGRAARLLADNWQLPGISVYNSGTPFELGMGIQGVNTGQTILGTYSTSPMLYRVGGAAGPSGGLQINPSAYYAPPIGSIGPYPRTYLRNPGVVNQDFSVFKKIPLGGEGARFLQIRVEMFNIFNATEFSGVNAGTQLVTASGVIGSGVFNNWPNVGITNNLRPAGSSAPLGQFFGEFNSARDPRIIQLGRSCIFDGCARSDRAASPSGGISNHLGANLQSHMQYS